MISTENGAVAFATTGNKSLDFFTRITRGAEPCDYIPSFVEIYNENPSLALKVLANLRDIRNGKGEKLIPRVLFFVLKYIDNETYEKVISKFVYDYGCWKDLLFICEYSNSFGIKNSFEIGLFAKQLLHDMYIVDQIFKPVEEISILGKLKNTIFGSDPKIVKNCVKSVSLAGKWAPTEGTYYDKSPLKLSQAIRHKMKMTAKEYRKALSKLRNHINVIERNLCEQTYSKIVFSEIPAVAHTNYRKALKRDTNCEDETSYARQTLSSRYRDYLNDLESGKDIIKSSGIHPHTIVRKYLDNNCIDPVLEAHWKNIIQKVKSKGTFNRTMAVVDVSGSMAGEPIAASIALGLIIAECTDYPFNDNVITFHENPTWEKINGRNLVSKVHSLKNMKWGGSTNIHAVFDMILGHAMKYNLMQSQMIDTIFIFTDMQFDECSNHSHNTNNTSNNTTFANIKYKYTEKGYTLPKIVCWNLRTSSSKTLPFEHTQNGVAMLSGFSPDLLHAVLDGEEMTPMSVFMKVMNKYNSIDGIIGNSIDGIIGNSIEGIIDNSIDGITIPKEIPESFIETMETILKK
jgi:hypothetical protein